MLSSLSTHRPEAAAQELELQLVRPLRIATASDVVVDVECFDFECCDVVECDTLYGVGDCDGKDEDGGFCDEIEIPCGTTNTNTTTTTTTTTATASSVSLARARRLLYFSLFCYHLSEMTWVFGSALWLAALGNYSSLFWISAYQATARVLIIALVPILSSKIDSNCNKSNANSNSTDNNNNGKPNRSRLVSIWIIGQHVCVMVTIILVFGTLGLQRTIQEGIVNVDTDEATYAEADMSNNHELLQQQQQQQQQHLARIGLVLICLCGGLAQVLHNALQVAIERDWIVVMAEEADAAQAAEVATTARTTTRSASTTFTSNADASSSLSSSSSQWLQDTNVALRQIYLVCQALGPLLTGFLVDNLSGNRSLWVVLGLKGISMLVVCACMHRLCEWVPALKLKPKENYKNENDDGDSDGDDNDDNSNVSGLLDDDKEESSSLSLSPNDSHLSRRLCFGWTTTSTWQWCCSCSDLKIYCSQKGLVGAGIGLALLYSNVLTFGGMMVAYLAETGNTSAVSIGLWKGLSDCAGFLGTVWFSRSRKDLKTKALWNLSMLVGCLTLSMAGIWMGVGGGIGSALVIAGVILSRIGLWGYDLSVVQLYQNRVAPSLRGTVGGTQTILNNVAEFVPFVLGMIVSGVDDFWIVVVVGYLGVGAALLSHVKGTYY
jgi:hypothetical protein